MTGSDGSRDDLLDGLLNAAGQPSGNLLVAWGGVCQVDWRDPLPSLVRKNASSRHHSWVATWPGSLPPRFGGQAEMVAPNRPRRK